MSEKRNDINDNDVRRNDERVSMVREMMSDDHVGEMI
jgi:hypothetical protein